MKHSTDFEAPIVELKHMINKLTKLQSEGKHQYDEEIIELKKKLAQRKEKVYASLTPWQTVQIARHPNRPLFQDYIALMCSDFIELHGDRHFGDDHGLIGGFATIGDIKVMIIGHNKGKNISENVDRNFGQAKPEGYRKAMRLMHMAEKYNLPVVSLIDTQGAYPGLDAEERGQAEAIARNLMEMSQLKVPIVCIVTGEGGSGGALGIGVGDVILMLANSVYSVISPEGCAAILWRDATFSSQAAEALKLTAPSLVELGIVDEIIPEPLEGAHSDYTATTSEVKKAVLKHLKKLGKLAPEKLVEKRFEKYSGIGKFIS